MHIQEKTTYKRSYFNTELTVFEVFEQLLLHQQQEVVVVLHLLGGVDHEGAHQVGAVRLVADPHGTRDGTEVHVVLVAGTRERELKTMTGVKKNE